MGVFNWTSPENMNMAHMISNSVKGSVTTEASIIIPIMIICLLPFIYLFRMLLCQMVMEQGLDECLKQMATEMYVLERISILPEHSQEMEKTEFDQTKVEQLQELIDQYTFFFEEESWKDILQEWGYELAGEMLLKQRLQNWLEAENLNAWGVENGWVGINVTKSDFLYEEEGHQYLIKGTISFKWKTLFSFWRPEEETIQRVYHCFVGEESEMYEEGKDEEGNDQVVYRIGKGTKYHSDRCYLINKNVYTSTRSQAEMNGKKPCERCSPNNAITIYQTEGGEHYHAAGCSYINPEVIPIEKEEATRLGYTGCGLCQEENHYFS